MKWKISTTNWGNYKVHGRWRYRNSKENDSFSSHENTFSQFHWKLINCRCNFCQSYYLTEYFRAVVVERKPLDITSQFSYACCRFLGQSSNIRASSSSKWRKNTRGAGRTLPAMIRSHAICKRRVKNVSTNYCMSSTQPIGMNKCAF